MTGLTAENVLIENIYYSAENDNEKFTPAICGVHNSEFKNVVIRNINCEKDIKHIYSTMGKVPEGITFE